MQLIRDEIELSVNLSEDVLKEKYGGILAPTVLIIIGCFLLNRNVFL